MLSLENLKKLWKGLVPHKIDIFSWIAILGKLNTREKLSKIGIICAAIALCVFCNKCVESDDHLFCSLRTFKADLALVPLPVGCLLGYASNLEGSLSLMELCVCGFFFSRRYDCQFSSSFGGLFGKRGTLRFLIPLHALPIKFKNC